jgi:thiosulfate dehydrogenase
MLAKRFHLLTIAIGVFALSGLHCKRTDTTKSDSPNNQKSAEQQVWTGPPASQIPYHQHAEGKLIWYGHELIVNTAFYLGPKGIIGRYTNGMNCQNCHLDAGTKPFGNNFGAVASTYPKFRERSGSIESIAKRVNDCFERSLNGKALDTNSTEMKAIIAYIKWLGQKVDKGTKPYGSGIMELSYLDRPADPIKGKAVFAAHCAKCHGDDGQGVARADGIGYEFPPLWGPHSYNEGAGLYRISRFAGFVYNNMPNTVNWHNPELTEAEAWDVAAFVNSQPRPKKDLSADWPNLGGKPIDHPFGPYHDPFTETQHKFGPFGPIAQWRKEHADKQVLK